MMESLTAPCSIAGFSFLEDALLERAVAAAASLADEVGAFGRSVRENAREIRKCRGENQPDLSGLQNSV